MSSDIEVRPARDDADLRRIAALRWRWVGELGTQTGAAEDYSSSLLGWAREHAMTHTGFVALRGGEAIGMSWVALQPRVPSPGRLERLNAEVQSVYVVPEERHRGVGTALMTAVLAWMRESGAEHATVQASTESLSLYAAIGFASTPKLLDLEL